MQAARGASLIDPSRVRVRRVSTLILVAAAVLLLDVVTKSIAVSYLTDRPPIKVVDGVLTLRLVRNAGAAFGLAQGMTIVLTCLAVAVIVVLLRASRRLGSTGWAVALGLVLGGAVGNLLDRLFRSPGPLRGHVIDFLELPHWPVFNVADMAIVSGAGLMVLLSMRGIRYDEAPGPRSAGDA